MSKEITALLLKKKLDSVKKPREYLIDCLKKQGFIKEEVNVPQITQHSTCKLCSSSEFIFTSHERICSKCGVVDSGVSDSDFKTYKQNIDFTKGTFIEPGKTIVKVIKNGVEVTRDLAKTNTFISQDPEEKRMKTNMDSINNFLEVISNSYEPTLFERISSDILSMWYNVLLIKPDIRGNERKSLMAWCIYYPIAYRGLNINIQRLASIIQVQVGEIYSYNFIMKDIFKDTAFEKYITVQTGNTLSIDLSPEYTTKIKLIKKDLKDYLSNPVKIKEELGIIYYISKLLNDKKYTLTQLAEKSIFSTNVISSEALKIERFYNKNVAKRNKLLIR